MTTQDGISDRPVMIRGTKSALKLHQPFIKTREECQHSEPTWRFGPATTPCFFPLTDALTTVVENQDSYGLCTAVQGLKGSSDSRAYDPFLVRLTDFDNLEYDFAGQGLGTIGEVRYHLLAGSGTGGHRSTVSPPRSTLPRDGECTSTWSASWSITILIQLLTIRYPRARHRSRSAACPGASTNSSRWVLPGRPVRFRRGSP